MSAHQSASQPFVFVSASILRSERNVNFGISENQEEVSVSLTVVCRRRPSDYLRSLDVSTRAQWGTCGVAIFMPPLQQPRSASSVDPSDGWVPAQGGAAASTVGSCSLLWGVAYGGHLQCIAQASRNYGLLLFYRSRSVRWKGESWDPSLPVVGISEVKGCGHRVNDANVDSPPGGVHTIPWCHGFSY